MTKNNTSFVILSVATLSVLVMSLLSLTKLGNLGDGNPLLSPLRIINRDTAILSIVVFSLIIYLWKKE